MYSSCLVYLTNSPEVRVLTQQTFIPWNKRYGTQSKAHVPKCSSPKIDTIFILYYIDTMIKAAIITEWEQAISEHQAELHYLQ